MIFSGHYQCQTNESGTIINGSSYELTVQNSMGSLDGEPIQSHLVAMYNYVIWHAVLFMLTPVVLVSCKSMPFTVITANID